MIQHRLFDDCNEPERDGMRALSIRQPWAWAILHAGKRIENRSWRTNYRGPLLLHAGKGRGGFQRRAQLLGQMGVNVPPVDELPFGAIVGIADLVDCVDVSTRPELAADRFADEGAYWWILDNVRAFDEPLPFRGSLNLFRVPDNAFANRD